MTPSEIAAAVERLLTDRGPMTQEQLQSALPAADVDLGLEPNETLTDVLLSDDVPLLLRLVDDRYVLLPALLDGRVFTHRVNATETEHDFVIVAPDLHPIAILTESSAYQRLTDGAPVVDAFAGLDDELLTDRGIPVASVPDDGALLLPRGCFQNLGITAGDLVGFQVTADGFEVVRADRRPDPPRPAVQAALLDVLQRDDPVAVPEQLDAVVWTACADDLGLFTTPLPPLADLLEEAGIARDGDWIAPPGFDFASWRVDHRIKRIRQTHGLDEDRALAVAAFARLYEQTTDLFDAAVAADKSGEDPVEAVGAVDTNASAQLARGGEVAGADKQVVASLLPLLADPDVAEALLVETLGAEDTGAAPLGLFAETLEEHAPQEARPALRWLRAKAHERLGAVTDAEQVLLEAERLDPHWPLTARDLARYASDRGDAERGLTLLRRAGVPAEDDLAQLLEQFRPQPRTDIGRNQRCWCASGRKYKQCHMRREELPLHERASWLYQKAAMFLPEGPWRTDVLQVAQVRAEHWETPDALLAALEEPLVGDAVLFEGDAFADFLRQRGALLPDDEHMLAEQWLLVERSVFEVEAVRAGIGLTVRDVRTGDRHEVREERGSEQLQADMLFCARIVPAGDTMQIFGGIEPIALGDRDGLVALLDAGPSPTGLVALLSRRFTPPHLESAEAEPLVQCEANGGTHS